MTVRLQDLRIQNESEGIETGILHGALYRAELPSFDWLRIVDDRLRELAGILNSPPELTSMWNQRAGLYSRRGLAWDVERRLNKRSRVRMLGRMWVEFGFTLEEGKHRNAFRDSGLARVVMV